MKIKHYRLIPIKVTVLFFSVRVASYVFLYGFVVLTLKNKFGHLSVDSVIVFYINTIITHSKLVLYLSEFLSSAEHTCYFEECGKPNSCWSPVSPIVFFYILLSSVPATVWLPTFFEISYFVFTTRNKLIQVWDNMSVSK